jgi:hypothetical protein
MEDPRVQEARNAGQHRLEILDELIKERRRQDARFPDQHLPNGTPEFAGRMGLVKARDAAQRTRDWAQKVCKGKAARGEVTWWDVLREEFYEVGAETDPARIREELIQVAAVAIRWIEDIDRGPDREINVPSDGTTAELDSRERKHRKNELARHLISAHAMPVSFDLPEAELIEAHEHEHDGPGTIRNHARASRHWTQRKIDEVLAEAIGRSGDRQRKAAR